jgi:SAM domain (Sterile alpha motif)
MNTLRDWLEAIGLGQYADAFAANDIDTDLLPRLDDRLLKDIGASSAGHRLRLRDAIENGSPRRQTPARDEARPYVRLRTVRRPVSQYAGSEGCTGSAGAGPHA